MKGSQLQRSPEVIVRDAVELLLGDEPGGSAIGWRVLHEELSQRYEQFSARIGANFSGAQLLHFLQIFLVATGRNGFATEELRRGLFEIGERMGVHILPVHFYSPIPDTTRLSAGVWAGEIQSALRLVRPQEQLRFLGSLVEVAKELEETVDDAHGEFHWNNPAFGPMDAIVYYSIVRTRRPARVMEVGSGYSTLVAARAASLNGSTSLICIEPYPMPLLRKVPIERLIEKPVQDVPVDEFVETLGPGDILFVDGTHVSKVGSDVNHLVLGVLPRLRPGVLVHFHDIFLPYEYPRDWVMTKKIFWNEQYVLLAYLLNAPVRILSMHYFLERTHERELRALFPFAPRVGGGSIWFETL